MKLETTNEIQNWKQNIAQQQKLETNCNIEMKMNLQTEKDHTHLVPDNARIKKIERTPMRRRHRG